MRHFLRALDLYAAALELGNISSGIKKQTYEKKALEHLGTAHEVASGASVPSRRGNVIRERGRNS